MRPPRVGRGSPNTTQLSARAGPNVHLLAQPIAQPKPAPAAAHPRNGEPRSKNSPHQTQSSTPKPLTPLKGRGKSRLPHGERRAGQRGLPEGEDKEGPWLTLPARGWGCRCVCGAEVGASATPGRGPHTCRPLCASSLSAFSLEFPSEGSPHLSGAGRARPLPRAGGRWVQEATANTTLPLLPVSTGSKWGLWT